MAKRLTRLYTWTMLLLALAFSVSMSGCKDEIVLEIKATEDHGRNGMFLVGEPVFYDSQGKSFDFTEEQRSTIKYKIDMEGKGFAGLVKNAQNTFDAYNALNIVVATGPTFADWSQLGAIKLLTDLSIPSPTPGSCVVGIMKSLQKTTEIIKQDLLKRRLIPIGWGDKLEISYPTDLFGSDPSRIVVSYAFQDYERINSAEVTATNVIGRGTVGPSPLAEVLRTVVPQCGGGILQSGLLDDDFRYSFLNEVLLPNCQARINPPYDAILRSATCEGSQIVSITANGNGVTRVNIGLIDCFGKKQGTISGRVTDASSGSVISNARVSTYPSTRIVTSVVSGDYTISDVQPGTYRLTATKEAYRDKSLDIEVAPGATATANILLSGSGSETEGLVAFYPFSGNANDESGHGMHGVVHGATLTTDRLGNQNQAYSFDGQDDYIEVLDHDLLDIRDAITIILWAKIDPNQAAGFLVNKRVQDYTNCDINYDIVYGGSRTGGNLAFQFGTGCPTGNSYALSNLANLTDNQWHHLAISLRFGQPNSAVWMIDGIVQNAGSWTHWDGSPSNGNDIPHTNNYNLEIGRQLSTSPGYFRGAVSQIRIYNRALSSGEIHSLYEQ